MFLVIEPKFSSSFMTVYDKLVTLPNLKSVVTHNTAYFTNGQVFPKSLTYARGQAECSKTFPFSK